MTLFPEPVESVYCRMRHEFAETDTESEALLVVTFAGGRTGICDLSGLATISKPRFYARGTRATFQKYGLDPQETAMIAGDINTARELSENFGILRYNDGTEQAVPTLSGRWRSFYENVADALLRGAELGVKPEQVRRSIAVLDAARQSAAGNRVISW